MKKTTIDLLSIIVGLAMFVFFIYTATLSYTTNSMCLQFEDTLKKTKENKKLHELAKTNYKNFLDNPEFKLIAKIQGFPFDKEDILNGD